VLLSTSARDRDVAIVRSDGEYAVPVSRRRNVLKVQEHTQRPNLNNPWLFIIPVLTSSNICTAMSKTITATINYSSGPTDGAKLSFTDVTKTDPVTGGYVRNWTEKPVQVEIEDLRGKEDSVTLDTAGFQYGMHKTVVTSGFYDEQEIKDVYYPESAALIKQVTGASHVVVFDHSTCI
jgi:hypothetical protein